MYDIAIIGLGPAGATLARLLGDKFKVIAIDKKNMRGQAGFQKPCGGLLALDAQKTLSKFSLALPKEILVDPQLFAVRTVDTKQDLLRYYQRFYINMDRHKFDLWLMSLIPQTVTVMDNSVCLSVHEAEGNYVINYQRDGQMYTAEAKYIVGADGANSAVRRNLFPKKKIRSYLSIQEWYTDQNVMPLYSCFFDSSITDCYAWSISKDGYFILGGAFETKNAGKKFSDLKAKLAEKGYIFGDVLKREACMVLRPFGFSDHFIGRGNAFFIGEAAGLISPSSLEGISFAFDSAEILAGVFNNNSGNYHSLYRKKVFKIRLKLFFKNIKSFFMYFPPARWLIMKSKILSIDVLGDPGK